jgi:HlyD family secretion protein
VDYIRNRFSETKLLTVFALVLILIALAGCQGQKEEKTAQKKRKFALPVEIGRVVFMDVVNQVRAVGNIQAEQRVLITSEVKGQITRLAVEEGRQVKAGDLLARIDPREYHLVIERLEAELAVRRNEFDKSLIGLRPEDKEKLESQVKADQSRLEFTRKELKRAEELVAKGFVAQSELDASTDQVNQAQETLHASQAALSGADQSRAEDIAQKQAEMHAAEKRLEIAQLDLTKAQVLAPFDGVIISKKIERGAYAGVGTPIVEMIGSSRLKAVLEMPQSFRNQLGKIRSGEFYVKELDYRFKLKRGLAERVRVIPDANIYSGNIRVQIDLPKPDASLFPGLTLEALLNFDTRKNVLHVPSVALVITEQGTVVYVMKDDKAHLVPVKAHKEREDFVEIEDFTRQLGAEAKLILRGSGAVFPGVPVFSTNPEPEPETPYNAASKGDYEKKPKTPPNKT